MTDVPKLRCPFCPLCGEPPAFILVGGSQAFCGNDECRASCWNPSETAAENLHVDVNDLPTVDDPTPALFGLTVNP